MTDIANTELPRDRKDTVEKGLRMFQEVAAHRDALIDERDKLKLELEENRVKIEAMESLISTLESRVVTHQVMRDQAVADRARYEAMFISFLSQLRAFKVPNEPLVKELAEEKDSEPR